MANNSKEVELYTTPEVLEGKNARYCGLLVVNKTKSRDFFKDFGSALKSVVGGELKSYSKMTRDVRNELIEEARQEARSMGANAIVGIRFETNTIMEGSVDMVMYGTAIHCDK